MANAGLTTKGRVTIPLAVRKRLGLCTGDRVEFLELEHGLFAIKPVFDDVRSLKGLLGAPSKPVRLEKMKVAIRVRAAARR